MVRSASPTSGSDLPYDAGISIIVPTYQEADNIPHLLCRLEAVRTGYDGPFEVLFMDDDSKDGSVEVVAASMHDWARIIVRTKNRGLSPAVTEGFEQAKYPILACMDCDLSHPPEALAQMVLGLRAGQQMVIGSRYVPGGSTDDDWGIGRWLNSLIATLLARPLTKVRDPMSGFFVMRKADFEAADELSPIGYKIALELIVKCGLENVGEVPIHFTDRVHGESKLTFKEQLKYLKHLRRLYIHRFSNTMYLAQFLVVGMSGVVVNLTVLSVLSLMDLADWICLAGGIAVSIVTNFLLNRRYTFSYARDGAILRQFVSFVGACAVGMMVNYVVALTLRARLGDDGTFSLQLAALGGIAAGMVFNFLGSRYVVFRKRFVKKS